MNKLIPICLFVIILSIGFASAPLIDNIISYYKLDETAGVTAEDEEETNDLTNYNSVAINQAGKIGTSYNFSGATNMNLANSSPTGFIGTNLSGSMWVYIDDAEQWDGVIVIYGSATRSIPIHFSTTTNLQIDLYAGGGNQITTDFTSYFDKWTHIAFSSDTNGNGELWLDGVSKGTLSATGWDGFAVLASLTLGNYDSRAQTRAVNGNIDEVYFRAATMNQDDVDEIYNSGDGFAYPFAPADTCTCAGAGNDWEINMSDYCNITEACDLTTGTLSFTGAGWTKCDAEIKTTNLGDPGATGILYILDDCRIMVS